MTQQTILIVDDNEDVRLALRLLLKQQDYIVLEAATPFECQQLLERKTPSLILLDMNFSKDTTSGQEGLMLLKEIVTLKVPIILMTAWANSELIVQGMRGGASDFIEKPWHKEVLLKKIKNNIHEQNNGVNSADDWIVVSQAMLEIDLRIQQFANTDANILILGENGTGKSVLAKRIHQLSQRSQQNFVTLNMAAIPDSLFESELFGHKKGAFTDAKSDRIGAFERADKGSLFMDEVGALPLGLQPKLLQVLETGEFVTLGDNNSNQADVRLIAATNQDLALDIQNGLFRQDLFYRLNTFVITLPPLRKRKADIVPLAENVVKKFAKKYNKPVTSLDAAAADVLLQHDWPGNIRELSHVIERAILICSSKQITRADILIDSQQTVEKSISSLTLEQLERQRIEQSLSVHRGNISLAAEDLGISRNALYRRMEKYELMQNGE